MSIKLKLLLALLLGTTAQASEVSLVIPIKAAIAVYGPIIPGVAERLATEIAARPDNQDVWLLIQGNGGMVDEGRKMINTLANAKARGIKSHCIVVDFARSMHTFLWNNCDHRYIQPMATVLWHKVYWIPLAPVPLKQADLRIIIRGLENDTQALYYPMNARTKLKRAVFDDLADTDVTGLVLKGLAPDYFKLIDSFEIRGQ